MVLEERRKILPRQLKKKVDFEKRQLVEREEQTKVLEDAERSSAEKKISK